MPKLGFRPAPRLPEPAGRHSPPPKLAPFSRNLPPPLKGEARECEVKLGRTLADGVQAGSRSGRVRRPMPRLGESCRNVASLRSTVAAPRPCALRWRGPSFGSGFDCVRRLSAFGFAVRFRSAPSSSISSLQKSRLVVEVDGGQHFDDAGRKADSARTRWLEEQGYQVLRVTNLEVDRIWTVSTKRSSPRRREGDRERRRLRRSPKLPSLPLEGRRKVATARSKLRRGAVTLGTPWNCEAAPPVTSA